MSDDTQPKLTEEEIEYIRKKYQQEKVMSSWALKVRSWITFIVLVVGAYTLLWDHFKSLIKSIAAG